MRGQNTKVHIKEENRPLRLKRSQVIALTMAGLTRPAGNGQGHGVVQIASTATMRKKYPLLREPAGGLTAEETARLDVLDKRLESVAEQREAEDADHDELELAVGACEAEMAAIEDAAENRAWTDDVCARAEKLRNAC